MKADHGKTTAISEAAFHTRKKLGIGSRNVVDLHPIRKNPVADWKQIVKL
jgi:hypothetical protein